jgi:predicted ATPase/class 3 adenylate cyclase
MQSISEWLQSLDLNQYAQVFVDNDIDLGLIARLSEQDLKELGVSSMGHRKKLLTAIEERNDATVAAPSPTETAPSLPTDTAERRHLTVMFCDLLGSTELSQKLDPEALRELMRSYQQCCGAVIDKYDGHVAQYLGDGLMTYFGWPRAHEDDAERAIRAGLEIAEAVKQVQAPEPLHVRVGIATGPVVVGETGAGDASVPKVAVGETPNLAARIQGLADSDQIIIGPDTRHLVGGTFDLDDFGEHALKGIVDPVRAWRVTGLASSRGRFDAAHGEELTPLIGREEELDILLRRWQLAQDGEGQVVLLSGEPGIGKSRVLSALREKLQSEGAKAMRFQCSPYYINSAFWPSIDNFERALKFARDESPESKLDKLESLIVGHYQRPLSDVRFIAAMLSIPCDARYGELAMTPQKFKDETLRTLVDLTEAAARKQPSVLLFEDAHWVDPTMLEVMDLLIDRVKDIPLLIALTHRPEFQNRWTDHGHVISLNLSKLTRAQSAAMTSRVAGGKALPPDLLDQILVKTDGVPLFVEELTKSILESGELKLKDTRDRYEYAGTSRTVTIPATLKDSLMARLDRYMPVKEVAQIGSAIGREFSYELISAVAPQSTIPLDEALAQLTESGLAFRRGTPPDAAYTFKHALVQDAAYDSLLKSRRRELHGKIANALEECFPQLGETEPEVLAHHYTEAGLADLAITHWWGAGRRAARGFATVEALRHFERGFELLNALPRKDRRIQDEVTFLLEIAAALRSLDRYEGAFKKLDQVEALCHGSGADEALSAVHHQRGSLHFTTGDMHRCRKEHEIALNHARRAGSAAAEVRALSGLADAAYAVGHLRTAHDHFSACVALCETADLREALNANRAMLAFTLIYATIQLDAARREAERAMTESAKAGDLRSELLAHHALFYYWYERDDNAKARTQAEQALELARAMGSSRFEAVSLAFLAITGPEEAAECAQGALEISRATGMAFFGPNVLMVNAMCCTDSAQRDALIAEAEALLSAGSLCHNHFFARRVAMDMAIDERDWSALRHHADELAAYSVAEPLSWSDQLVEYGRALATYYQYNPDQASADRLRAIGKELANAGSRRAAKAIGYALEDADRRGFFETRVGDETSD